MRPSLLCLASKITETLKGLKYSKQTTENTINTLTLMHILCKYVYEKLTALTRWVFNFEGVKTFACSYPTPETKGITVSLMHRLRYQIWQENIYWRFCDYKGLRPSGKRLSTTYGFRSFRSEILIFLPRNHGQYLLKVFWRCLLYRYCNMLPELW